MAFLLRSIGLATAITGDPAALSPQSRGSYHASSTCIATARRPQGVSTTFSRRLYNKQITIFGNFQMIIAYSYCTIKVWCSISKFWIAYAMMMNTTYSDENDVVVVRTSWNRGGGEDAMKSPLQMLPFSRRLCHVCTTRVLRLWRCYDAWLTTFATPPRSHRVLTAFQIRSPNLGICFEHAQNKRSLATMATTARCLAFLPRSYHTYGDLGALLAHSPSP